jgi:molybdate transport system substrate-binding protein
MRFSVILFLLSPLYGSQLTVGAAADLIRVGPALAEGYRERTGTELRFSYGSSGMLAQQIEHGAPFDVFLSADESYINKGIQKGYLAGGSKRVYALGLLAMWARESSFRRLGDLATPKLLHLAIANPTHAPYGAAAAQALRNAGLWERLQGRIVYGENIRQTLQYAESGNADAAITAWSLVFDRGGVLVPQRLYDPIRQCGAVTAITRQRPEAERFLQFLSGAAGQQVLRRFGFLPPR